MRIKPFFLIFHPFLTWGLVAPRMTEHPSIQRRITQVGTDGHRDLRRLDSAAAATGLTGIGCQIKSQGSTPPVHSGFSIP